MESYPFTIDYYITEDGKKPFKEWLDDLRDVNARAKIRVKLDRIRIGNLGDTRSVGQGVYEMRIDYGPGYRVYYGLEGKTEVLLILGGDKTSQEKDIGISKEYWCDHRRRKKHA